MSEGKRPSDGICVESWLLAQALWSETGFQPQWPGWWSPVERALDEESASPVLSPSSMSYQLLDF